MFENNEDKLKIFIECFDINPQYDMMCDFVMNKSLIRCLYEQNKTKELIYLVNRMLIDYKYHEII